MRLNNFLRNQNGSVLDWTFQDSFQIKVDHVQAMNPPSIPIVPGLVRHKIFDADRRLMPRPPPHFSDPSVSPASSDYPSGSGEAGPSSRCQFLIIDNNLTPKDVFLPSAPTTYDFYKDKKPFVCSQPQDPITLEKKKFIYKYIYALDTTSSMNHVLRKAVEQLSKSIRNLQKTIEDSITDPALKDIRIDVAVIAYADYEDTHPFRILDFTAAEVAAQFIEKLDLQNGFDEAEDIIGALYVATSDKVLTWSIQSDEILVESSLFLVYDSLPHGSEFNVSRPGSDSHASTSYQIDIDNLLIEIKKKNIQVFGVPVIRSAESNALTDFIKQKMNGNIVSYVQYCKSGFEAVAAMSSGSAIRSLSAHMTCPGGI